MRSVALFAVLALAACSGGGSSHGSDADAARDASLPPASEAGHPDGAARDAAPADAVAADAAPADAVAADAAPVDATPDAFVVDPAWNPPPAAPYRVGVATRRMPVPVGIGTSGFGANQGPRSVSPYANIYPGTTDLHTHPDFRAIVFEAGAGNRLILVRSDTIGVSAAIRRSLVARLQARYGPEIDRQLIIAATHTHSGPGRLIDKPLWHLIQDYFWPEFYVHMVDAMEAAVVAAMDDLEPARIGNGDTMTTVLHHDRRCADPEEDAPDLPFLRVDRADGSLKAVVLFHPIHGTVLGIDRLTLSQDVSGTIEKKIEERFDHPVTVIFFNGAAADMGPGDPPAPPVEGAAPWPDDFQRIERVGNAAADVITAALPGVAMEEQGIIHTRTARVPINRQVLGYAMGEFPHEWGAVYCGAGAHEACVGEDPPPRSQLMACLPFPDAASSAPRQAPLTAARIGSRLFVTMPGEFSTELGRRIRTEVSATTSFQDIALIGYAQEYTGYSLPEDDWWRGGYETTGALWGPRQGDYLTRSIIALAKSFADPNLPLAFADQGPEPVPGPYQFDPRPAMPSAVPPAVVADVPSQATPDSVVEMSFEGGDPWLGNPVVTLEKRNDDGTFAPVTTLDGRPVTSDAYVMVLHLEPDPPYTQDAEARHFRWTVRLPVRRPVGGGPALEGGAFRLVARGRAQVAGAATPVDYELPSAVFTVP